jgi:hypothetical protein
LVSVVVAVVVLPLQVQAIAKTGDLMEAVLGVEGAVVAERHTTSTRLMEITQPQLP